MTDVNRPKTIDDVVAEMTLLSKKGYGKDLIYIPSEKVLGDSVPLKSWTRDAVPRKDGNNAWLTHG